MLELSPEISELRTESSCFSVPQTPTSLKRKKPEWSMQLASIQDPELVCQSLHNPVLWQTALLVLAGKVKDLTPQLRHTGSLVALQIARAYTESSSSLDSLHQSSGGASDIVLDSEHLSKISLCTNKTVSACSSCEIWAWRRREWPCASHAPRFPILSNCERTQVAKSL